MALDRTKRLHCWTPLLIKAVGILTIRYIMASCLLGFLFILTTTHRESGTQLNDPAPSEHFPILPFQTHNNTNRNGGSYDRRPLALPG